jgi:hypothetical protein
MAEDTRSKRARNEIPETSIGIYIFGHAELSPTDILTSPKFVNITKSNLGGYGCLSYPTKIDRRKHLDAEKIAQSLTTNMTYAITCPEYTDYPHGVVDRWSGKKVDSHMYEIDKEGSCQIFENNKQWVLKEYSPATIIMFSHDNKTCDLMQIPCATFIELFNLDNFRSRNAQQMISDIKRLFNDRPIKGISSYLIFCILYLFQKKYEVAIVVRIIDESCNASIDKTKLVQYEKSDGTPLIGHRAFSKHSIKPLAENIGYGGKKKKNRNRTRKK